jgi:hypothetical protein
MRTCCGLSRNIFNTRTIKQLLAEERENLQTVYSGPLSIPPRLGRTLADFDADIGECKKRIVVQGRIIEKLRARDRDTAPAQRFLETLDRTLCAWRAQRELAAQSFVGLNAVMAAPAIGPTLAPAAPLVRELSAVEDAVHDVNDTRGHAYDRLKGFFRRLVH